MGRHAIVMGATGLVGKALVEILLNDSIYDTITAIVRRPLGLNHPKLVEKIIDFRLLDQIDIDFYEADVFCTIGTTIKKAGSQEAFRKVDFEYPLTLGQLVKSKGARQFLLISSMGANPSSRTFYIRIKGEIEEALKKLNIQSLHIFRPSLLLGNRDEFRIGEGIASLVAPIVSPLLRGSFRKYRPIHAESVAKAMLNIAKRNNKGIHIYESNLIDRNSK